MDTNRREKRARGEIIERMTRGMRRKRKRKKESDRRG